MSNTTVITDLNCNLAEIVYQREFSCNESICKYHGNLRIPVRIEPGSGQIIHHLDKAPQLLWPITQKYGDDVFWSDLYTCLIHVGFSSTFPRRSAGSLAPSTNVRLVLSMAVQTVFVKNTCCLLAKGMAVIILFNMFF